MNCFAIVTRPLRVPAAALSAILSSEPALKAIQAHAQTLFGQPVEIVRSSTGVSFRIGYSASIRFNSTEASAMGPLPTEKLAQFHQYVRAMAMAVRQQQIAAALGSIAKVTRDVQTPAGVRTISIRV